MRIVSGTEEVFPAAGRPCRSLRRASCMQVLVGEPPVPCVGIFAMLPALNRLSDTRPGEVLVASLPCFELKALQLPLLQHCGTLRELPLRLPAEARLGPQLRDAAGPAAAHQDRQAQAGGVPLPRRLCAASAAVRRRVPPAPGRDSDRIVELRPKPEGGELVPWGRRAYADLAAAAEAAMPRGQ